MERVISMQDTAATIRRECSNLVPEHATPILLASSPANRAGRLVSMRLCLWEHRENLLRLLKIQEDIAASTQLLHSYTLQLGYAMASISALPAEILTIILDMACPIFRDVVFEPDYLSSQLHLTHVCSHWRALLISDPRRWTAIPISAKPHEAMMVEFASRARQLPVSLRFTYPTPGTSQEMFIPPTVSEKLDVLVLTQPEHFDLLHIEAGYYLIPMLHLGFIEAISFPDDTPDFAFDPFVDDRFCCSVSTLTCANATVSSKNNDVDLPFVMLMQLNMGFMTAEEMHNTISSINAPHLTHVYIHDLVRHGRRPVDQNGKVGRLFGMVETFIVSGDQESLAVVADFVRGIEGVKVDNLDLSISPGALNARWIEDLADVLTYAARARNVSLAATAPYMGPILNQVATLKLARLDTLQLLLLSAVHSIDSSLRTVYEALQALLISLRPARLKKLEISSEFITEGDNGWLDRAVDELVVLPLRR